VPQPRNQDHRTGPQRVPSFGHKYGDIHDVILKNAAKDDRFYTGISNTEKVDFICETTRLQRSAFSLDMPLPIEDWSCSDDQSLIIAGLFLASLREDFYERLFESHPETRHGPAWANQAEAEYWFLRLNAIVHKRSQGIVLVDMRVMH
jgi:hypothetical protein